MYRKIWVLILIWVLAGCAGPKSELKYDPEPVEDKTEVVETEGITPIIKNQVLQARSQALAEAQRKAVEQVVGIYVSSRMMVSKAILVENNILSRTSGYIKKYTVISESQSNGFYKVKIRARVKIGMINDDLEALGLLINSVTVGDPRIAVLIDEYCDGKSVDKSASESELTKRLIEAGYRVISQQKIADARSHPKFRQAMEGETTAIGELGKNLGAELLIIGKATSRFYTDKGLGGLVSYRSEVQVKVVEVDTGVVVATKANRSGGVDISGQLAATNSLYMASASIAKELVPQIAQGLNEKVRTVITISGLSSLNELSELKSSIAMIPSVANVYARSFDKGTAIVDVDLKYGNTTMLAADLENMARQKLKITGVTRRSITARMP